MKRQLICLVTAVTLFLPSNQLLGGEKRPVIPISDILKIVTEEVPGRVVKAELKEGLYEIKIITKEGTEEKLYIDAMDGKILERAGISLDEASRIALEKVPGEIVKVEFERGKYEFKILTKDGNQTEVKVDSRTGRVLKVKEKEY